MQLAFVPNRLFTTRMCNVTCLKVSNSIEGKNRLIRNRSVLYLKRRLCITKCFVTVSLSRRLIYTYCRNCYYHGVVLEIQAFKMNGRFNIPAVKTLAITQLGQFEVVLVSLSQFSFQRVTTKLIISDLDTTTTKYTM